MDYKLVWTFSKVVGGGYRLVLSCSKVVGGDHKFVWPFSMVVGGGCKFVLPSCVPLVSVLGLLRSGLCMFVGNYYMGSDTLLLLYLL